MIEVDGIKYEYRNVKGVGRCLVPKEVVFEDDIVDGRGFKRSDRVDGEWFVSCLPDHEDVWYVVCVEDGWVYISGAHGYSQSELAKALAEDYGFDDWV